jgi:hypothetical protein
LFIPGFDIVYMLQRVCNIYIVIYKSSPYAGLVLHHLLQTARPCLAQHYSCVTLCFASCSFNSRFEDFPLGICSPTEGYRLSSLLYIFVPSFLYLTPSIARCLEHSKNIITPCWPRLNLGSLQMRHFWFVFAQFSLISGIYALVKPITSSNGRLV